MSVKVQHCLAKGSCVWSDEGQHAFDSGKLLLHSPAQVRSKYNSGHVVVSVPRRRGNECGIEQSLF